MLLGLEKLDSEQVTSHKTCRLGKWYYGDLSPKVKEQTAFKQLEEPHKAVHRFAKQAVQNCEDGNLIDAEKAFEQLQQASNTVVALLSQIE